MKLRRTTGRDPDFIRLTRELDAELLTVYGDAQADYAQHNLVATDTAIVATVDGAPAGCGCFKRFDDDAMELKRMFVDPAHRGTGVGRAMLAELETWAKELSYRPLVLEPRAAAPRSCSTSAPATRASRSTVRMLAWT